MHCSAAEGDICGSGAQRGAHRRLDLQCRLVGPRSVVQLGELLSTPGCCCDARRCPSHQHKATQPTPVSPCPAISRALSQLLPTAPLRRPPAGLFVEQGSESFERQMRVNYLGTVHSLQAALPGMLERRRGRLVIVSSSLAVLGFAGVA